MSTKNIFWFVPNTITSLNALAGSMSIVFAFEGNLVLAGIFILIAAVLDFFDGMSARLLKAYSPMGKELDSLADMISFGLAPAVILHVLVRQFIGVTALADATVNELILVFFPFMITIFSGLRLAKFNIDTRQTESFIGLATPANAMVWASIPFILAFHPDSIFTRIFTHPHTLLTFALVMSLMLVAELPMFSLKFKSLKFAANKSQYIFLAGCTLLLGFLQLAGIPLIILWYIVLSLVMYLLNKKEKA